MKPDTGGPMDRTQAHAQLDTLLNEIETYGSKASVYRAEESHAATGLAIFLMMKAADLAANVCGPEIVAAAYGPRVSCGDRAGDLRALARRLMIATSLYPFEQHSQHQGSIASAYEEAAAVGSGDEPKLFARLDTRKVRARVIWQKKRALCWDAYLDGLGISLATRRPLLISAFGAQWDTISRWGDEVDKLQGDGTIASAVVEARKSGAFAATLPSAVAGLSMMDGGVAGPWQDELAADGRRYKEAVGFTVVGSK